MWCKKRKSEKFLNEKNVKITTFGTTLVLLFKKIESDDKTKYDTFFSHSKVETIINESGIDDVFESIYTTIISNILKSLRKVQAGLWFSHRT